MDDLKQRIDALITQRIPVLAEMIVDRQFDLHPGFREKFGPEGRKISVRDAGYHLPFLTEAILASNPDTFRFYVRWVKTLFRSLNLPDNVMVSTLECTRDVLTGELPGDLAGLVREYIGYGLEQMEMDVYEPESYIDKDDELGEEAGQFMNLLLAGKRSDASHLILSLVKDGVPVKKIYLNIFQKSQYEIGNLWLTGKISIAQEHFCSAATQMIISQLYPYIFSTSRKGFKLVAACVGGELHEMGIRMVADFFEMDGWDTFYLGANTPAGTMAKAIENYEADLLGLSVAMPYHQSLLKETIEEIRQTEKGRKLKILIGGNAFLNSSIPPEYFGANGFALDAQQAVEAGNKLMNL